LHPALVEGLRHLAIEPCEAGRNARLLERTRHVGIWQLHVLQARTAEALSHKCRDLAMRKIARPEQLANGNARPVARHERIRGDLRDVSCRDHWKPKVRRNRIRENSELFDHGELVKDVLEERHGM
jgi:hypothetical protein